jgi:S1-C subfamily serine protease
VRIAGKSIKNIEDYMEVLTEQKKGNTVEVGIIRNGKKMTVKVKLE